MGQVGIKQQIGERLRPASVRRRVPRFLRTPRYPVWSATTLMATAVIVAAGVATAVLLASSQPLLIELEWTVAILAACLFVFLTVGLYGGWRIRREKLRWPMWRQAGGSDVDASLWGLDLSSGGADLDFDLEGGCLAPIVALLVSLVVAVGLVLVISWLLPVVWGLIVVVSLSAWWVCYLALRRVFVLSKRCRGNLGRSLWYAWFYTAAYTGWLFAVLAVWHFWR